MTGERRAYLNAVGTAVPQTEMHRLMAAYALPMLKTTRDRRLFERMVQRCGIERRHSVLFPARSGTLDDAGLYRPGNFAGTAARMRVFE
jgi:alpha-pyrone synthase